MRLDELAGERQADADQLLAFLIIGVDPRIAVEHAGPLGGIHPLAGVGHRPDDHVVVAMDADRHAALRRRVGDRVGEEMVGDLAQPARIAAHQAEFGVDVGDQRDRLFIGRLARRLDRLAEQGGDLDMFLGERQVAGGTLGEVEHILDEAAQPADRGEDRLDIFAGDLGQLARIAGVEQFGEAGDRGQRHA